MKICIFEDSKHTDLFPLSMTKSVYDLKCGCLSLREKAEKHFGVPSFVINERDLFTDSSLDNTPDVKTIVDGDDILFLNSRILVDRELVAKVETYDKTSKLLVCGTDIAAIYIGKNLVDDFPLSSFSIENILSSYKDLPKFEIKANFINYPWDLISNNRDQLIKDFDAFYRTSEINGTLHKGVYTLKPEDISVGSGTIIKSGTVIDAESGNVFIGKNVTIEPNVFIEGPVFIGNNCLIRSGARIYGGTTIGEVCKIGGEIENSIIHAYSNKQHDGFLGHSYLGEWVNLGANTNTSDLKNNYSNVRVEVSGKKINTNTQSLGTIMGDHSKTGINTMLNTGTIIGSHCNVFGSGFPPKSIPSFVWGGSGGFAEYSFEKAVETAKAVMKRRNREYSEIHLKIDSKIFENSSDARRNFLDSN